MSISNIEKINFSLNFKPVDLLPTIAQPQWQEATTSSSLRAKQRRLRQESALLAQAPLNIAPIQST